MNQLQIFKNEQFGEIRTIPIEDKQVKRKWKVERLYMGDKKLYSVYRLKNIRTKDQPGNRDETGLLFTDREKAEFAATILNYREDVIYE